LNEAHIITDYLHGGAESLIQTLVFAHLSRWMQSIHSQNIYLWLILLLTSQLFFCLLSLDSIFVVLPTVLTNLH